MLTRIRSLFRSKGYALYTRPYELNIVGIRADSVIPNRFDDEIHVFYRTGPLQWDYHIYKATTDPGTYWLNNPMQEQGTAILEQGQYRDAYQLGYHREEYLALVQRKPVTVIRDYNRNSVLDFFNGYRTTGLYGINIHRAFVSGTTRYVDRYSAGCQVFANVADFNQFLALCRKHEERYGNRFTYTLIDMRSLRRQTLKHMAIGAGILAAGAAAYYYFKP